MLVAVKGLRRSDADTLMVLTQDVLRNNLTRIEGSTLADLLALSELEDGLGVALKRDLAQFRMQMFREMTDLPDGSALTEFTSDLTAVDPSRVPTCLRVEIGRLHDERRVPESVEALRALLTRWEDSPPDALVLPVRRVAAPTRAAASAPAAVVPRKQVIRARTASASKKASTPVAMVDERRAEWVQDEVMNRLERYGVAGLKEAVLVAGARHRSPWKDLGEDEVLSVLRRLRRENRLGLTSGRWHTLSRQ